MGIVTKKRRITREIIDAIECDCCGLSCSNNKAPAEYAMFFANWGYGSDGKDGQQWECILCENCAGIVKDFIEASGGKVPIKDPYAWDQE